MNRGLHWIAAAGGLLLIGDFYVLMRYGYAIRSTNLFIARGLVFYPLAWLNLAAGVTLLAASIRDWVRRPRP